MNTKDVADAIVKRQESTERRDAEIISINYPSLCAITGCRKVFLYNTNYRLPTVNKRYREGIERK